MASLDHAAPPPGTQDLLFDAARRLRRCESALASLYESRGYAEAIPPLVERMGVFEVASASWVQEQPEGDAGEPSAARPLRAERAPAGPLRAVDRTGHLLGLRSDFTAQIARIAATRLAGVSPLRLYYRGSVLRDAAPEAGELRETLQAGCELVGLGGAAADAEVLSLAAASLRALGIPQTRARLSVGNVGWFSALCAAAGASPRLLHALWDAVDRKDRPSLEQLCRTEVQPGPARDALLQLARLPAPQADAEALLAQARRVAPSPEAHAALDALAATLPLAAAGGAAAMLEVDLGEVRGLGYYTGLIFNLYTEGAPRAVGGGGRYDGLLGRFGDPRPAVGFSLDLDALAALAAPEVAPC
jgi:ATP phosphoribosyltransferase regulatory subunit